MCAQILLFGAVCHRQVGAMVWFGMAFLDWFGLDIDFASWRLSIQFGGVTH